MGRSWLPPIPGGAVALPAVKLLRQMLRHQGGPHISFSPAIQGGRGQHLSFSTPLIMQKPFVKLALTAAMAAALPAQALEINFDYSLDSSGFFGNPVAKAELEYAGQYFAGMLYDQFDAFSRNSGITVALPGTTPGTLLKPFDAAANTVTIFVGGVDYSDALAKGGPTFGATRGEPGNSNANGTTPSDFVPSYGRIGFDTSGTNWYFDADPTTTEAFTGIDFLTVALHEVGHVLGIGTAPSFDRWINAANQFTGPEAMAVYGSAIPLDSIGAHWASGTKSPVGGTGSFDANLDPAVAPGHRELFTDLDKAVLADIGWELTAATAVPEPSAWGLALAGMGVLASRRRAESTLS
jgi:PEP-CTERM motif